MATEGQPATQAKRILVVEDELMIRMLLEDMLGELGYTVAAEAARIDEALEATKNADFDLAILDAHLNGQPVSCRCPRCPRHAVRLARALHRRAAFYFSTPPPANAGLAHPSPCGRVRE